MAQKFGEMCTGCGQCCRNAYKSNMFPTELLVEKVGEAPVCKNFEEVEGGGGRCSDYENRPDICKVDKYFWQVTGKKSPMPQFQRVSKQEWHALNVAACNQMQTEAGMDEKFRVVLKF